METGDCLVRLAVHIEDETQVIVCPGKIWLQGNYLSEAGNRLFQPPQILEDVAKIANNAIADKMSLSSAAEAYKTGMIDSIMYKDQLLEILTGLSNRSKKC